MTATSDFEGPEFLNHLIKGMAEGVIFIDDKNIIRLCNAVGGVIRGVEGEKLIGKPFLDCHPKKAYSKVLQLVEDLKKGKSKETTRTVKFKKRLYEHTYTAVKDNDGKFLGIVSVSRDVTKRETLESKLKEHADKLEHSNAMKDLFIDILRHDILNPASVIKNFSEMIIEDGPPDMIKLEITAIKRSSDRLIEMIENARTLSTLEDINSLEVGEKDLGWLIENAIEDFQSDIKKKALKVDKEFSGKYNANVSSFIVDVFTNLISNAVKYSKEGGRISIKVEDEGEDYLISVSDQAEAIPLEHREAVFERFKRVGKEGVKGSGMGLAIVKRIVFLHKGKVWVDENKYGGNTFKVKIPKNFKS